MPPGAVARVLVVDSNLQDLLATRKLLTASGAFEVLAAHNSAPGLQLLREQGVDALVVDQTLADGDGVEFLRSAVEGGFEGAVIFTAAQVDRSAAAEVLRLGVANYVAKTPTWPAGLPQMLVRALERTRLLRQNREVEQQKREFEQRNRELQEQLVQVEQELDALKVRDSATGLYREWYFEECRAREVARAKRLGRPVGVIELRVEQVPRLQAVYGAEQLDKWIALLAKRVVNALRTIDIPAYVGEGRFRLLLLDCDRAGAALVANRLRQIVEGLKRRHLVPMQFEISVGTDATEQTAQPQPKPQA